MGQGCGKQILEQSWSRFLLPFSSLFGDCRVDPGWVISAPSSAVWALHAPLNITALALTTTCCPVYSGVLNLPTMGSLRVMRCNAQPTIAHQPQHQVSLKTSHGGKDFTTVKVPAPGPSRQYPVHSDGDRRRCLAHSAWGILGWIGPVDGVSSAQRLVLGCMWP